MAKKSSAASTAKRAYKKNPKAFIVAVVAIILIVVVAVCVLRFAMHDVWESLVSMIIGDITNDGGNDDGDTAPPLNQSDGSLYIHFLDVGQGDCIYIQFPDDTDMLIDCGNKSSGYDYDVTKAYLDALNADNAITHLMLTHTDEDHVDQLNKIVDAYQIDNIYMPNIKAEPGTDSQTAAALTEQINALDEEKLNLFTDEDTITTNVYAKFFIAALSEPDCTISLTVDPDLYTNSIVLNDAEQTYRLTFYCQTEANYLDNDLGNAHEKNSISPIGVLEFNNRKVLLTGDANEDANSEPQFVSRIGGALDCDVLKVAHHGSATSSCDEFLDAVDCEYAIISCNPNGNTYKHPTPATLDRLAQRNMIVYRTDNNGNIVLEIDKDGNMDFTVDVEVEQSVNLIGTPQTSEASSSSESFVAWTYPQYFLEEKRLFA